MLSALARAADIDRFFGTVLRPVSTRQYYGPTGIGHQTDIEDIEGIANRSGVEHFLNGQWVTIHGFWVQRRPGACRHGDLGPLLQRSAIFVHVAGGNQAKVSWGSAKTVRDFILATNARIAATGHPHARASTLTVRDHGHIAQMMLQGGDSMLDQDHEGAPAHTRAIHITRRDPQRLTEQSRRMLASRKDTIHIRDLESSISDRVGNRLQM